MSGRFDQLVTFVYVRDLDAASEFYGGVLGLEQVLDQGACRIFAVTPMSFIGICHDPERASFADGVILTLVTDLVDEWSERLADRGVQIERGPVFNEQFNIYHTFIRDPDGHLVEIQQFQDARWPRA